MNFLNSIWVAIVSMTTVGYGDITPKTGTGGYIGLIWSTAGLQITAFFLLAFAEILSFNRAEQFSYTLIENIEQKEYIKDKAMNFIVSYYKYKHRGSKRKPNRFSKVTDISISSVSMGRNGQRKRSLLESLPNKKPSMKIWGPTWSRFNKYAQNFLIFRKMNRIYRISKGKWYFKTIIWNDWVLVIILILILLIQKIYLILYSSIYYRNGPLNRKITLELYKGKNNNFN